MDASGVVDIPLELLRDQVLDISHATPCRFRLIDCVQITNHKTLRIHEFVSFPPDPLTPYTAISYVWRGNPSSGVPSQDDPGTFSVKGAEDGDLISIDALYHACVASIQHRSNYIWFDRLCIMQTCREDKAWQIGKMFDIYKSCALCVILPGGIGRLVGLDEETAWIHRAWTLQEALAPALAMVLFAWKHGDIEVGASVGHCTINEVVPLHSAMAPLMPLLRIHSANKRWIERGDKNISFKPAIFGKGTGGRMPVLALAEAKRENNLDAKEQAVWRCAFMRTSSRPADMIFSIMGIFGISLNVRAFDEHNRTGATIALAQEILRRGGKANWLGTSLRIAPSDQLSWFPQLPESSVATLPRIQMQGGMRDVRDMMSNVDYDTWLEGLPSGKMDDDGYFFFTGKTLALAPTGYHWFFRPDPFWSAGNGDSQLLLRAKDQSVWEVCDDELDSSARGMFSEQVAKLCRVSTLPAPQTETNPHLRLRVFVVFIGTVKPYLKARPSARPRFLRAILIMEHAPGKFHRSSYFELDDDSQVFIDAWPEREVCIGGPHPPGVVEVGLDTPSARASGNGAPNKVEHNLAGEPSDKASPAVPPPEDVNQRQTGPVRLGASMVLRCSVGVLCLIFFLLWYP